MKFAFKFIVSLALALLLAWAVHTYAFTIFSVPVGGLPPQLEEGNRVIVNRMDCENFTKSDLVVFADSVVCNPVVTGRKGFSSVVETFFIGRIERLPGDTILVDKNRYAIPTVCCKRCGCKDCRYYLVRTVSGSMLVHKHQILGKAYKLF